MDSTIGDAEHLQRLRQKQQMDVAVGLAQKFSKRILDMLRKDGMVITPDMKRMAGGIAEVCADTMMDELAVLEVQAKVGLMDVPPDLRQANTQEIIENFVAPQMAASLASALVRAGLVRITLGIPPVGDGSLSAHFIAWGYALKQQTGPASMPNVPRLDYGRNTTVYPRARGFAPLPGMALKADEPAEGEQ